VASAESVPGAVASRPRPHIVVGVDPSPSAARALAWAAEYARLTAGTLIAVTASASSDASLVDLPEAVTAIEKKAQSARSEAQERLEDVVRDVLGTDLAATVVARARSGGVADVLLSESAEADLLVIGTTPRGALGRALLSSLRPAKLTQAHCPVVFVPALESRN